ncbi:phosphatidylinositol transfer protein [Pseudoalteromonas piscicida]|uniref:LNS2 domain-containing protein n=1 Tax=Pseudoalteromonas piscicida TaxID=43662 RepID=UPI0005FA1A97|nr:phosphatidylinositol transfer protein [Pseudoalteromonas piscicida]KJY87836.1 phosphatidylinositol transfer protein [Pseudoalteromonas piscicida]
MRHSILTAALFASFSSLATPTCPSITALETHYAAPNMVKRSFSSSFNKYLSWLPSYHMVHDQVTAAGAATQITAKFDYGSIAHKDLEFESVEFYYRAESDTNWQYLGEQITNGDGKAFITLPELSAGQYRIYAGVPADGTGAQGYVTVVEPGTQAVLFDIDGTLTESDAEQIGDYTGIDHADPKDGAYDLVRHYLDLGYQPVFLTARVYWYAKGTRGWLSWMGLPQGFLRTSLSNETSLFKTAEYKTAEINRLKAQGIDVVRAYGNAKTDAEAFIKAGIPASEAFTIGSDAGHYGTTAITGNSYQVHLGELTTYPHADCL